MSDLFLNLFNISVNAGWLVLAVLLLRIVLKKAPKYINCILWGLVGVRLIFPFSIESVFSLLPSGETVPPEIVYSNNPEIHTGIDFLNSTVNPIISDNFNPTVTDSANPMQVAVGIFSIVWAIGIAAMLLYLGISFLRIKRKVREATVLERNIFICDNIGTPFILGVIKPKIYLPSTIADSDYDYVIAHENAHIKRLDYLWKPLGFLLLTVYWFNPLLWLAYVLLCRDIEFACDERVINSLGSQIKKPYSEALINCSVPRRMISACPLAFGETGVKGRIKSVLNYKKPTFWIIVVGIVACIITAVCFLTNPKDNSNKNLGITETSSGSEHSDVELEILEGRTDYITVLWKNNSDKSIWCGDEFKIFKGDMQIEPPNDYGWDAILNGIQPNTSIEKGYNIGDFGPFESGTYRLEKEFYFQNEPDKKYKAYVEFKIDSRYSFSGKQYPIGVKIFDNGSFSSILYEGSDIPQFSISEDLKLLTSEHPKNDLSSAWYEIGELEEFKLKKANFDDIANVDIWNDGYSAEILRKNNLNAFKVENKADNNFYYLLEQKNGEIYIAKGILEPDVIRWVFKMEVLDPSLSVSEGVKIYTYNDSPEPITAPTLSLDYTNRKFSFTWSLFSSYLAMGNFETEGDSIICSTNDGLYKYVFEQTDNGWRFNGERSSQIPSYKYSADAEKAECPVPDGAEFTLKPESDKKQNPYFNATVLEVLKNSILVKPDQESDERKISDKIYVSTEVISTNPVPSLKKGERVRVVYNGQVAEVYPANINKVFAIYKLDKEDEVIFESGGNQSANGETLKLMVKNSDSKVWGISISLLDYDLNSDKPYFNVEWKNDRDEEFAFGEPFDILKRVDGEWVSCTKNDLYFYSIGIILNPKSTRTKKYDISAFDLTKGGEYRFKTQNEIWFDFVLSEGESQNITDKKIKTVHLLNRGKSEKTEILKTFSYKEAEKIGRFLNTANLEQKNEGNWVKFNPASPNDYSVAIIFEDETAVLINIFFTENEGPYYLSLSEILSEFSTEINFKDLEYTRYIASSQFGEFLSELFL